MINQPRRRRGALLSLFAVLMLLAWVGMVFAAKGLSDMGGDLAPGYGAFIGFFVICMSVVTYVLFMMAVDSDKS